MNNEFLNNYKNHVVIHHLWNTYNEGLPGEVDSSYAENLMGCKSSLK